MLCYSWCLLCYVTPGVSTEHCTEHRTLQNFTFQEDSFLKLSQGVSDDLVIVSIEIDQEMGGRSFLKDICSKIFVHEENEADVKKLWTIERQFVMEVAFEKFIFANLVQELKGKLRAEAEDAVIAKSTLALKTIINVAPIYQWNEPDCFFCFDHRSFHVSINMFVK